MGDFLRAEVAAGRTYLPSGANVLRAFQQPFDDVRVLIVGQDPYPTPGMAMGLSFSVAPEVPQVPGSLENIFREMHTDLGLPRPSNGDLTPWTRQGVLLLNRALTTAPRKPGAHRGKGWEEVTEQAIRALAARGKPLVSVLWGVTPAICGRSSTASRRSSPRIPRPCRRTAASSARARSAGPTNSCCARGPRKSTGGRRSAALRAPRTASAPDVAPAPSRDRCHVLGSRATGHDASRTVPVNTGPSCGSQESS